MTADLLPDHVVQPRKLPPSARLFRHRVRPEWGVGLWVREGPNRRRLRFEDGVLRAFRRGHYDKLEPVDPDVVDADALLEELGEAANVPTDRTPPVMSFDTQRQVFARRFEGGLAGEAYRLARRRPAGDRSTRRHVEVASDLARELLSRSRCADRIAHNEGHLLMQDVLTVGKATAWLAPRERHLLQDLSPDDAATVARALNDLLWSTDRLAPRFRAWVKALESTVGKVSWPLATVFPALVHPDQHVYVRRQVMRLQARSVRPGRDVPATVSAPGYRNARSIANATRERLESTGVEVDLMDVACFMWETLRPSGQKVAKAL